jgi:sulfatase modifying factor 1
MNKNPLSLLIAMASLVVTLGASVRLAAQDKAVPSEKKPSVAKYVPIKMDAAEVVKLQADWAAKLNTKSETKTSMGIAMVLIPPAGEALPKPYWIGKYELTQGEWKAVTGSNPASFANGKKADLKGLDTNRLPVETVTWFECLDFCNRLSEKEGLKPYYGIKVIERRDNKQITKAEIEILGGEGYRLPTNDEWAHACRAGSVTDFYFGGKGDIDGYGWVDTNSDMRPHTVGEKKPNAFGLHDTHGNVREWTLEFTRSEKTNVIERAKCFGGSFHYKAEACGVGSSGRWHGSNDALWFVGMRLARDTSPATPKK